MADSAVCGDGADVLFSRYSVSGTVVRGVLLVMLGRWG